MDCGKDLLLQWWRVSGFALVSVLCPCGLDSRARAGWHEYFSPMVEQCFAVDAGATEIGARKLIHHPLSRGAWCLIVAVFSQGGETFPPGSLLLAPAMAFSLSRKGCRGLDLVLRDIVDSCNWSRGGCRALRSHNGGTRDGI